MQNYSDIVLFNGQPLSGASVTVLNYPAGTVATIYIDNGITQGPNPITTNVNGRFNFYAANGRYSLQIAYPNTTTQTLLDFPLENDPGQPTTANINSGTITNVAISNSTGTNLTVSNSSLTNTTAPTQGPLDNSTLVATDAFVANQIIRSKSTTPVTIAGGIYNLNVTGSGLSVVVNASAGVITTIPNIPSGGSGYAVGDVVVVVGGNIDGIIRVTSVSAGVVATVQILYGGSGYGNGNTQTTTKAGINGGNIITLTGALTSNATIIFVKGTPLTASSRVIINNNTTGAFTVSVFMSNGAGGTIGSGIVVPQGSNNSTAMILQTDGQTDVWSSVGSASQFLVTGTFTPSQTAGIVGTTTNNNAQAGSVGEYVTANTLTTAASTGVALNATSISLTAGDWNVWGIVQTNPAGTTTTSSVTSGINTISATFGTAVTGVNNTDTFNGVSVPAGVSVNRSPPMTRLSLAATTTVYLVAQVSFAVSTLTVSGFIQARRVR